MSFGFALREEIEQPLYQSVLKGAWRNAVLVEVAFAVQVVSSNGEVEAIEDKLSCLSSGGSTLEPAR